MSSTTDAIGAAATAKRPPILALLGWLAFAVLLVYVIFIGGGYRGILSGEFRWLSLGLIALGLVVWAVLAIGLPSWRPRSAIWPALVAPLTALLVASLLSGNPRLGLEYVAWATLLVALYLLLARILSFEFSRARIGGLAAILGFTVAIAYLVTAVTQWLELWNLLGRLTAPILRPAYAGLPFGGPTAVATVTVLLVALAFTGLGLENRKRKVVLAALALVAIAAVFITGGRTAWLATVFGSFVVGVVFVLRNRALIGPGRDRARELLSHRTWQLALIALVMVAALIVILFAPAIASRLNVSSDGGRNIYFATAMRMFDESPIVGQGPGTWAARRMVYTEAGEPDIYVSHAHNIYSQTLAEVGLLGIAAGAVAVLALLWLIRDGLHDPTAERRRYGYGALFVLLYFGAYGLLDSYADLPLAYLLAALPFALLDGTARRAIGDRLLGAGRWWPTLRTVSAIALFGGASFALVALARIESIASTNRQAVVAVDRGDWETATAKAAQAVAADPDMVPYRATQGLAAVGAGDWQTAEASFERTATADDRPEAWINLALARLEEGRAHADVVDAIERATRVDDRSHSSIRLAAAYLYDRMGMAGEADDLYIRLLAASPSVAADPYWTEGLLDPARFDRLVNDALAVTDSPWELALMTGDADQAQELVEAVGGSALATDIITAWTGDPAAAERVRQRSLASRGDRTLSEWATRVSAREGDEDATARFRRIQRIVQQGSAGVDVFWGWEDGILPVEGAPRPGTARYPDVHGAKGYRRAAPISALAHGLPVIVLVDLSAEG